VVSRQAREFSEWVHESTAFGKTDLQELQGHPAQRQSARDLLGSAAQAAPGMILGAYLEMA
jgi:hypothetical protein